MDPPQRARKPPPMPVPDGSLRPYSPSAGEFRTYDSGVQDRPRPLFVPDLTPPPGAAVDRDGTVRCIVCDTRVSFYDADLVGQGYRCPRCSALATPEDNVDASLKPSEKALVPDVPTRKRLVITGCCLVVVGVIQWITKFDLPMVRGDLFEYVFVGAIGCFALAIANHRQWG